MGYLLPFYITPISRHFGHVNDWIFLNSQFFEREITNLKNELIQFTVLPIILSSKIPDRVQQLHRLQHKYHYCSRVNGFRATSNRVY